MAKIMWAVGTDSGDMDWIAVNAPNEEEAVRKYAERNNHFTCHLFSAGKSGPCVTPCRRCGAEGQYEVSDYVLADRVSEWDNVREIKPLHWLKAGLSHACQECGEFAGLSIVSGAENAAHGALDGERDD